MKIRRNLAILGIISILFGCGTLYWMTDSTFRTKRDFPSSEYQDVCKKQLTPISIRPDLPHNLFLLSMWFYRTNGYTLIPD